MTEREKLNWRTFADDGAIVRKWNFPMTPAYYVIDAKGTIRQKWMGFPGEKAMDATLEKLIEEAEKQSGERRNRLEEHSCVVQKPSLSR